MRELQKALIPDDENGDVLRRMLDDGDDLTLARPIDFFHVFAEESDAQDFAAAAARPSSRSKVRISTTTTASGKSRRRA